jgi:hypothetical protein
MEKTKKVDYENIIKEISALVPGLSEQIDKIIEANTKIEEKLKVAKAPQLRVDIKEEFSLVGLVKIIKTFAGKLLRDVKTWGRDHDAKIKKLKEQLDLLFG